MKISFTVYAPPFQNAFQGSNIAQVLKSQSVKIKTGGSNLSQSVPSDGQTGGIVWRWIVKLLKCKFTNWLTFHMYEKKKRHF